MKFRIGEYVRYYINGVCYIEDIRKMDIMGDGVEKMFYVLKSSSRQASTIYVPADNDELVSRMELPVSKEQIDTLIDKMNDNCMEWIDDKKKRTEIFKSIIKECDRQDLLSLIECMHKRKEFLNAGGKNLSSGDESILSQAEGVIQNEFSYVLGIEKDCVAEYVMKRRGK